MSLVPFTASAAASKGAEPLSHQGTTKVKAPGTPPVSRGHAAARAESAPPTRRNTARFAHVLEVVQQQEEKPAAMTAESQASSRQARPAGPEFEPTGGQEDRPAAAVTTPAEPQRPAAPQTPWLLLALGAGVQASLNEPSSSPDSAEALQGTDSHVATAPVAPATVATHDDLLQPPVAMVTALSAPEGGRVVLADAAAAAPSLPCTSLSGAVAEQPSPGTATTAAATSVVRAVAEEQPADQAAQTPEPVDVLRADPAETMNVPQVPEAAAGTGPSAPSVDLARWRAAARGSGEDPPMLAPSRSDSSAGAAAAAGPIAGQAATRLAQALGRARPQGVGSAGPESAAPVAGVSRLHLEGLDAASALATPSSRPGDALLRLAQAGGHAPAGPEGGPPPSTAPVLATAGAGSMAAAMTATAPAAPSLPPEAAEQVVQQLVSSLKLQWKDGVGEARLHLRPDALGSVSVSLRVEAGAVTAVVRAENSQVQEWVVQHQQTLRQQMEAAGLRLEELVVSPDDQRRQAREESSPQPERRRQRGATRPGDSTEAPRFDLLARLDMLA